MTAETFEDLSKSTVWVRSFKHCALVIKDLGVPFSLLNIGDDKMLLENLIIDSWQVVSAISNPDEPKEYSSHNSGWLHAYKVSFFDLEKFPYVIYVYGSELGLTNDYRLANLKDKSSQPLVKAHYCSDGFCIKTGDRAFDFHFTSSDT